MKSIKQIILFLVLFLPLGMIGQINRFAFNSPALAPRPMAVGGDAIASFEVVFYLENDLLPYDYSGDDTGSGSSLPATQFVLEFSKVKLKNDDVSLITADLTGTLQDDLLEYYKVTILPNGNLLFSQKKDIPGGIANGNGIGGRINVPITAIGTSTSIAPENGFKAIPYPDTNGDPSIPFNDTFILFNDTVIDSYTYTVSCVAGSTAPTINNAANYQAVNSSYKIPCGSTTADLSSLTASNTPAETVISWHSSAFATSANRVDPVTAVTGATKKFYASFYDAVAGCYSPTKEIIIYAPICAFDDNYTSTTIVEGVGGTLPSIYKNDTYNGIDISTLPSGSVNFDYEMWDQSNGSVDPGTGIITIPATTPAGTYQYTYKICDNDPDAVVNINCAVATVIFTVSQSLVCYKPAVTSGAASPSLTGISDFLGTATDPNYWISNMPKNGDLVLGSHTKGFVITRVSTPETAITQPIKGMLVFDTTANCLKMYDGTSWFCLTQKCVD
ncbi:hypothetical protein GON26_20165 [Flavobacterium sp. GA093]|uniref:Ig-like domain-containing protein n=1 Tax=Flavobacterium hydrocarbonoxydans TaxID=2683249 RepID=A0A6I4NW47_9FLAO|nr:hypothetical protein [Flavobacterium hydrocarbonoxydans]MWB96685.1 hypothetical protein [Flavobacterium hydrocarbonoxydans]